MQYRIVICDRCGAVIEDAHPDRITVAKQHYESYRDHFGKEHKKSVYKNSKPIHLCEECRKAFELFLKKEASYGT